MKERVQKLMAKADIGSRRECERIIEQGRVKVNGHTITLGDKADLLKDTITVDGNAIFPEQQVLHYFVIYKPKGLLSTNKPHHSDNRLTVRDSIPVDGNLFTIGRLDANSEGLMVMTNDGDLTHKLTHPRYEHTKTYKVVIDGSPTAETIEKWETGIWLPEGKTASCYIKVLEKSATTTTLRIVMTEGKKRQIRRVALHFGHHVKRLMRTHIGKLGLGTLREGEWYQMDEEEIQALQEPADELMIIRKRRQERKKRRKMEREQG